MIHPKRRPMALVSQDSYPQAVGCQLAAAPDFLRSPEGFTAYDTELGGASLDTTESEAAYPSLTTALFAPRRIDFVIGLNWLHHHRIAGASAGRTLGLNSIRDCFSHLNLSCLSWRPLSP